MNDSDSPKRKSNWIKWSEIHDEIQLESLDLDEIHDSKN